MANTSLKVYHLDDDLFEVERVKIQLRSSRLDTNFVLTSATSIQEMKEYLDREGDQCDVYLLDINIEGSQLNGIEIAEDIRKRFPNAVIVMSSNLDDGETVIRAIKAGADDFISKACDGQELALRIVRSYTLARQKRGDLTREQGDVVAQGLHAGQTMKLIESRLRGIIDSAVTSVFVSGESGTGKEVVADILRSSLAKGTPFVRVNCGAIAPGILESELFGHVKGAFSGAISDKQGFIEAAHHGWIFLDEVATLTLNAQIALLRALESQEVTRVGSTTPISVQFRVLAATNESIPQLIESNKFRLDLWQRLRESEIQLPPLRERMDEIPRLVEFFCTKMRGGPYRITQPTIEILNQYDWREGNIRELRNCLRAMTEFSQDKLLTPLSIPQRIMDQVDQSGNEGDLEADFSLAASEALVTVKIPDQETFAFAELEDQLLVEVIRYLASASNKPLSLRSVARKMSVSRSTLSQRLKTLVQKGQIKINDLQKLVNIIG